MRQGAVLSPIPYAVFTSDLLYNLERSGLGTHIDNIYCGSPTYADDMALVSHSPTNLQLMLDIVSEYAHKWEYTINPSKSQILIFSSQSQIHHHLAQHFTWKVGGYPIPISEMPNILVSSSSNSYQFTYIEHVSPAIIIANNFVLFFIKKFQSPPCNDLTNHNLTMNQSVLLNHSQTIFYAVIMMMTLFSTSQQVIVFYDLACVN